jgi:predicted RNA binding protein YcfA (HicA-like mRNA interferase family)
VTSRIPHRTAETVVKVLERHGFDMAAQRGSHQKWRLDGVSGGGRQVIVPFHQGHDLPTGTMKSIIDGSGLPFDDFGGQPS